MQKFRVKALSISRLKDWDGWPVVVFALLMSSRLDAQPGPAAQGRALLTTSQVLIIFLTLASITISGFLAIYAWQRRAKPGILAFAWLMTAIAESSLASAFTLFSRTRAAAEFWRSLNFLGVAAFSVLFLIFVLQYSGRERWFSRWRVVLLFLIPLATQVIIWTNRYHSLFFGQDEFIMHGALAYLKTSEFGPWFRVHVMYMSLMTLSGMIVIISMIVRPFRLYRQQAVGLLLGVIPPVLNSAVNVSNRLPEIRGPLTLFSYTFMGSIFAWTLFRHQFLDVLPVARDTLVDKMTDGVLVLDSQQRIIDINPAAQKLFGQASTRWIGQPVDEALQLWTELCGYLRQDGQIQAEIVFPHHESERYYHLQISPLTDKRGRHTGKLIMLRDITARKRAELELLQAHAELQEKNSQLHDVNASKDKFFSIISHDLRGPFATLLGLSELLDQNADRYSAADIKHRAHLLHTYAERLYNLLENLLTWSRLQRGAMQRRPEPIRLHDITENNCALYMTNAEQKNITLTHAVPQDLWVYADYTMINTVVHNLVSNALKFTPDGGSVTVSAHSHNQAIEVAISDTGVGIPSDDFGKLFRIDEQYTHAGTHGEKGSGLGLILCQELVQRNEGKIWVESEPDKGSTFRFTLPAQV